jgi:hypothetical protein
LSDRKAN